MAKGLVGEATRNRFAQMSPDDLERILGPLQTVCEDGDGDDGIPLGEAFERGRRKVFVRSNWRTIWQVVDERDVTLGRMRQLHPEQHHDETGEDAEQQRRNHQKTQKRTDRNQ